MFVLGGEAGPRGVHRGSRNKVQAYKNPIYTVSSAIGGPFSVLQKLEGGSNWRESGFLTDPGWYLPNPPIQLGCR